MTYIVDSLNTNYLFFYVILIFIILLFLIIFGRNDNFNSYMLFVLGIATTFLGSRGNFSGVVFLIFSFMINSTRNKSIVMISVLFIGLIIKNILTGSSIIQFANHILMHGAAIAVYFVISYNPPKQIDIQDDQLLQIINYRLKGISIKEIADKTCMTQTAVNKRLNRLSKKMGCKNPIQFGYKLSKIRQKNNKIDKVVDL